MGLDVANFLELLFALYEIEHLLLDIDSDDFSLGNQRCNQKDPDLVPEQYMGTFNGPGFILNSTPSTVISAVPNAQVAASSELHGSLWAIHIGPYMEIPLKERFFIHASGGLSLALLDVDFSWNNAALAESSGKELDYDFLSGAYLGGELNWYANEFWMLSTGLKFEFLTPYEEVLGGNEVTLDLSHTLYWTLGVSRDF